MEKTPQTTSGTAAPTADTTPPGEDKHSFNWGWMAWPFVVLFLYVLSLGPFGAAMLKGHISKQGRTRNFLEKVYAPWYWVYDHTPLHKPLGVYMHLWAPKYFDKSGDEIPE